MPNKIAQRRRRSRTRLVAEYARLAASRRVERRWEQAVVEAAARVEKPAGEAEVMNEASEGPLKRQDSDGTFLPFELATDDAEAPASKTETDPEDSPATPVTMTDEPAGSEEAMPEVESDTPSAQELLYNAAREAEAQRETRRATAIYRELLDIQPGHVAARNNLALLLDQSGDHEAALGELQECLGYERDNPRVLVNRGAVLGALARYGEAERDLRRAMEIDATNAEAHFNLGLIMSRKGLWGQALPYLRRSIELDAGQAAAYFYLGEALNHVDDLEGAQQSYQRAIELGPDNPKAFYGLGIIYDRLNRPDEAAQMYRRSREIAGR